MRRGNLQVAPHLCLCFRRGLRPALLQSPNEKYSFSHALLCVLCVSAVNHPLDSFSNPRNLLPPTQIRYTIRGHEFEPVIFNVRKARPCDEQRLLLS
jgi:hypothetical protein